MPQNSGKDYKARHVPVAQPLMAGGNPASAQGGDVLVQPIAFSSKDHGADAETDLAPTLRAGGHSSSHANAGAPPAIAFNLRGREGGAMPEADDLASMRAASGGSSRSYIAASAVRRLVPEECEVLQGFWRGYTDIPWRGKDHAPDGPRYKSLGNSMCTNVMAWIGQRIAAVEAVPLQISEAA